MDQVFIATILSYLLAAWLSALAAVIALRLLRGDINTKGLLQARADVETIDPERVTMMIITLLAIGGYAINALSAGATFNEQTNLYQLPDAPDALLVLLAGGNTLYLAGKISRS